MAKRRTRSTPADQTPIAGTEPPEQKFDRKIENRGKAYVEALAERMEWQQTENNARAELDAVLEERKVSEYWLKDGTKITRDPGKAKIKVKFPKNYTPGEEPTPSQLKEIE